MARQSKSKLNTQIYEEACEWFVEFRSGTMDAERRREADRWLRKSPEQLSAYLEVAAIWNEGPSLGSPDKYPTDELISSALSGTANVVAFQESLEEMVTPAGQSVIQAVPIEESAAGVLVSSSLPAADWGSGLGRTRGHRRGAPWPAPWSRHWVRAISASVCGIAVACGALYVADAVRAPTYVTRIGEQRSFELADGSTVSLNSRSKIRVRFTEKRRDVQLLQGQALFHVAKDTNRPFVVDADGTKVRAVGTEFDVDRKRSGTLVTVVEGRVAVATDQAAGASNGYEAGSSTDAKTVAPNLLFSAIEAGQGGNILLAAGEQLSVTGQQVKKLEHANVANATAWTHRQLVFEFATLADVAEEFNRYNVRQLVVVDPGLDTFHITGVFSSTDSASIIRFLNSRPGLRVVETHTSIRIERKIS